MRQNALPASMVLRASLRIIKEAMNKRIQLTAIAGVFALASTSLMAADQGAFFINGNLGQAHYHDSGFSNGSNTDTASALRAGYDWNVDHWSFGAEGGYADLGKATGKIFAGGNVASFNIKTTGWLLGGNAKYRFDNHMFVSARLGWFRSNFDVNVPGLGSQSFSGNGAYSGLGVGYDFSQHFSLGMNYDGYHGRATFYGTKVKESIGVYSAFAEYRF